MCNGGVQDGNDPELRLVASLFCFVILGGSSQPHKVLILKINFNRLKSPVVRARSLFSGCHHPS